MLLAQGDPGSIDKALADAEVSAVVRPIAIDMESVFAYLADSRAPFPDAGPVTP